MADGLSLDVDNVTVRGAGMDASVLDFTGAGRARARGCWSLQDGVTLRDFGVENPKGDGIKSKGADDIVYHADARDLDRRARTDQRRLWASTRSRAPIS